MSAMTDQEQLDTAKSFFKKYGSAIISGVLIALIALVNNKDMVSQWICQRLRILIIQAEVPI